MLHQLLTKIINTGIGGTRRWLASIGLFVAVLLILLAMQLQVNYNNLLYGSSNRDSIANFLVINKVVDGNKMDNSLTSKEINQLRQQPFVQAVGELTNSRFKVSAQSPSNQVPFYTDLFFESVPNQFIDVQNKGWTWKQGDVTIPMIVPNQFLDLYNFGFAPSQNLAQLSQDMVMALPVVINVQHPGGLQTFTGRVVGFSDRISSVLVPENFLDWANKQFGTRQQANTSRVVIRTADAGDPALAVYLKNNGLKTDAEKTRFSKYRLIVDVVVKASASTGVVLLLFALLVFSLFVQLTIAATSADIQLLVSLGTSPTQLQRFLMQKFMPANLIICAVCLVTVWLVQFAAQQFLINQQLLISPMLSLYTVAAALAIILVLWLVTKATVRKYIFSVAG